MTEGHERILIVNADDFGLSPGVNRGILRAHEEGIVTSTSVMVRWPAAADITTAVHSHPNLSLGLHVDVGEWIFRDGEWTELYRVIAPEDSKRREIVMAEVNRQVAAFHDLAGQSPSHLDSHQHAHRSDPLRSILKSLSAELKIPLRHFTPAIRYCGDFYGQSGKGDPYPDGIAVGHLLKILHSLPPGVTELCCHPGYADDIVSQYKLERATETQVLCDPMVRDAVASLGIRLSPFRPFEPVA